MPRHERPDAAVPPPAVRLKEFFRRLSARDPFFDLEDAYQGLCSTLNQVEDELTGIENNPDNWMWDGRLYPPQRDSWFPVPGRPDVIRMRTRGHSVFIQANGAIEIVQLRTQVVVFTKAGRDGGRVTGHD